MIEARIAKKVEEKTFYDTSGGADRRMRDIGRYPHGLPDNVPPACLQLQESYLGDIYFNVNEEAR